MRARSSKDGIGYLAGRFVRIGTSSLFQKRCAYFRQRTSFGDDAEHATQSDRGSAGPRSIALAYGKSIAICENLCRLFTQTA